MNLIFKEPGEKLNIFCRLVAERLGGEASREVILNKKETYERGKDHYVIWYCKDVASGKEVMMVQHGTEIMVGCDKTDWLVDEFDDFFDKNGAMYKRKQKPYRFENCRGYTTAIRVYENDDVFPPIILFIDSTEWECDFLLDSIPLT